MLRKCILVCFFFSFIFGRLYSQALTVDRYTNQLLFNIFKEQPDSSILDFSKQYLPSLAEKKKKDGIPASTPLLSGQHKYAEIHSFIFARHPFLKTSFTSGKLEFFCLRNNNAKDSQVTNVKFWLEFDTQPEAEMAFSNMIETFIPISTQKKFSSTNGSQKAEFSDEKETNGFGKIRIRLTADNLDRHTFKILLETENDL
ncbi:MAG: hypothetical protein M0Q26_03410 [Chitinophagaceae bacterium]|nr:hypothetical protein [Chitinophagaceae bacterium]